jgi:hypothetical protein
MFLSGGRTVPRSLASLSDAIEFSLTVPSPLFAQHVQTREKDHPLTCQVSSASAWDLPTRLENLVGRDFAAS